jgi:uncharacterized repeat protein (TIGR03803 family)
MRSSHLTCAVGICIVALWAIQDAAAASYNLLHSFSGSDGRQPRANLTLGGSTLYGATAAGGTSSTGFPAGTVFKINVNGTGFQSLATFTGPTATGPQGGLMLGGSSVGGAATGGGTGEGGTIFSVDINTGAISADSLGFVYPIHYFPNGDLVDSGTGTFAGTLAGSNEVFVWFQTKSLSSIPNGPSAPKAGLVRVGSTLFGTTEFGGANNKGTVFSIRSDLSNLQVLHSFTGGPDGSGPTSKLTVVGSKIYGTANGGRTIYSMNPDGSDFQVVRSLGSSGEVSNLSLVGKRLFGTTPSTVFTMKLDGSEFEILHSFVTGQGLAEGGVVYADGSLYGVTDGGGQFGLGTIYRISGVVPEPGTFVLAIGALGGLPIAAALRRKSRR